MLSGKEIERLGYTDAALRAIAERAAAAMDQAGHGKKRTSRELKAVLRKPERYLTDRALGELARALFEGQHGATPAGAPTVGAPVYAGQLRGEPVASRIWGRHLLDQATLDQFNVACRLPVAVRGAQMPDGHVGYGLPIGGVLGTRDAVIPYAVGVDIACRMRLTVYDESLEQLDQRRDALKSALRRETSFGIGADFEGADKRQHAVMDDDAWCEVRMLAPLRDKAHAQLGSSGSGNHFVEWGELETADGIPELELPPGRYLALLSHSGSRGLGHAIASHYTKVAQARTQLPKEARHLAWLDLASAEGQEYWRAMNLAGRYASANHELIHEHVTRAAGLTPRTHVENHHNFAWAEEHDGETLIVHRKGATPAGAGVLGVIPGSMGDPGYVVRGKGNGASLDSAAHGAGRVMSRSQAKKTLTRRQMEAYLQERGIELLAAGLDESPQVYKRIDEVMREQSDLVDALAAFHPRIVLMAGGGPAED